MRRYIIAVAFASLLPICISAQSVRTPYDASAARKDLANVDAATGRAALDAEQSGSVATHAADTSTHGVATVAGLLDIANLQAAANASDALNLRRDGSRAMTGNLKFNGNYGILQATSDGADNGSAYFGGGGDAGVSRGAFQIWYGNEHASYPGQTAYYAGNVSTGDHVFYTGAGTERFRIGYDGTLKAASNLMFSSGYTILPNTADESDNKYALLCGGGAAASSRGSIVGTRGNEYPTYGGCLYLDAGAVSTGHILFRTGSATSDRMAVTYGGNVLLGTTTDDGTNKLQVNGSVAISSFMQLASPTAIPTAAPGRIYFNGTESKFKKCLTGTTWVDL